MDRTIIDNLLDKLNKFKEEKELFSHPAHYIPIFQMIENINKEFFGGEKIIGLYKHPNPPKDDKEWFLLGSRHYQREFFMYCYNNGQPKLTY